MARELGLAVTIRPISAFRAECDERECAWISVPCTSEHVAGNKLEEHMAEDHPPEDFSPLMSNANADWFDALGKPVSPVNRTAAIDYLVEQGMDEDKAILLTLVVGRDISHDEPDRAVKVMRHTVNEELGSHGTETVVLMALAYLTAPQPVEPS